MFGLVKIGQGVSTLRGKVEAIDAIRVRIAMEIEQAKESRRTVIATIGSELSELEMIAKKL